MRRIIQLGIVVVVTFVIAAALYLQQMYSKTVASLETSQQAERTTQDQYARAIDQIAEIQDSLATIMPEGETLPGGNASLRGERAMGGASGEEILERIASVRAGLERGKARIAKLEDDLKANGMRVNSLQKLVAGLRRNIKEREDQLAAMSTQLAEVRDTLQVRETTLADRQHELATVYFVAGPKRELMKAGVITARGGVLGIGKTITPTASAPEQLFSALDTDMEQVLPLNAAKARVVTAQPAGSYELRLVDGRMQLHILDPAQFRKVRQLVIVTA
jgi:hypothetical protein